MTTTPRRRWFAFSLRTLFVLVTLVACWLGYSLNWIKQRRENSAGAFLDRGNRTAVAPAGLWLFGEPGYAEVWVHFDGPAEQFEDVKKLYPEANVIYHH